MKYDLKKYQSRVWLIIIIALVLNYLYAVGTTATNSPFRFDDSVTFLAQFMDNYLDQDFGSKFDYFFMPAIHPHPKITLRIVSILSYHIFGEINFEGLRYLTSFCVILFAFGIWYFSNVKSRLLLFIPFVALLLVPNITNTWVVILGNTITSILVMVATHSLIKRRILLACLCGFLLTFNGPTGMFIFPIGLIILFLLSKTGNTKVKISDYLIWLGFASFSIWFFVIKVFKREMPEGRNDGSLNLDNLSDILGIARMFFDTTFTTLKNAIGIPTIILVLLGAPLILYAAYKTYRELLEKNTTLLIPLTVSFYYLALVGVISIVSYNSNIDTQTVYTRYECYSNYILSLLGFIVIYTTKSYTSRDYFKIVVLIIVAIAVQISGYKNYYTFTGKRVTSAFERRLRIGIRVESDVKEELETNDINYSIVRKIALENSKETEKQKYWIKEYKNYRELLIYREAIDKEVYYNSRIYDFDGFIEEYVLFDSY